MSDISSSCEVLVPLAEDDNLGEQAFEHHQGNPDVWFDVWLESDRGTLFMRWGLLGVGVITEERDA